MTADPKAPAGEVPLTVSLMPAATNTNDIATASFSVQGLFAASEVRLWEFIHFQKDLCLGQCDRCW